MTIITGGTATGIDLSLSNIGSAIADLNFSTPVSPSGSDVFTLRSASSGITYQFTGFGFGNPDLNGVPQSGTVTGYTESVSGVLTFAASGASFSVASLRTIIFNNDAVGLTTLLLGGNDTIVGTAFGDSLFGYAGNDTIQGGVGTDIIDGGTGSGDVASYIDAPSAVTVSLSITTFQQTGGGGFDSITNVEGLIGSNFDDVLTGRIGVGDGLFGGAGNDTLIGRSGGDLLDGGSGSDTASYTSASSGVYVFIGDGGSWTGDAAGDTFISIENVTGSAFNDVLGMDGGVNVLDGGSGDDTLFGNGGADVLIGGTGFDTASYATAASGVYVFIGDFGNWTGDAAGDTFSSIEAIIGTAFNDILGLDNGANRLVGGAGNDVLYGNGGGDQFFGNAGFDTVSYATAPSGVYVFLTDLGNATGDAAGDSFFSEVESIIGSNFDDIIGMGNFNDTLIGGGGNDVLYGLGGGDTFFGNDGFDTVSYALAPSGVYVFYADLGNATGEAAGDKEFSSIEGLVGSAFNDILGAGNFADTINGGGGADILFGQGGNDTLTGGAGADLFAYLGAGFGSDTITDFQDGSDRIDFSRMAGISFASLALTQETGGVRVTLGGDSILIAGQTLANITSADFLFGP